MIDMVVHRHKLRETLSRLCSLFMDGAAHAGAGVSSRRNGTRTGTAYKNGRAGMPAVIDAEPVDDSERVDMGRLADPTKGKDSPASESKTGKSGTAPAKPGSRI